MLFGVVRRLLPCYTSMIRENVSRQVAGGTVLLRRPTGCAVVCNELAAHVYMMFCRADRGVPWRFPMVFAMSDNDQRRGGFLVVVRSRSPKSCNHLFCRFLVLHCAPIPSCHHPLFDGVSIVSANGTRTQVDLSRRHAVAHVFTVVGMSRGCGFA